MIIDFFSVNKESKQRALTLVELIIYVTLLSSVMIVCLSVVLKLVSVKNKNTKYISITNNLRYPLTRMAQEIRNAKSIMSVTANTITLESFDSARNPTVISWNGSKVLLGFGPSGVCSSSTPCQITDDQTNVSSWLVRDKSSATTSSLEIEMVAQSTATKAAWSRSESYVVSATLRSR